MFVIAHKWHHIVFYHCLSIFIYHNVFIHSATKGLLSCFQFFLGMNFLVLVFLYVGAFLEDISRCGIAGFQEMYILILTRDGHLIPQNDCSKYTPPNSV